MFWIRTILTPFFRFDAGLLLDLCHCTCRIPLMQRWPFKSFLFACACQSARRAGYRSWPGHPTCWHSSRERVCLRSGRWSGREHVSGEDSSHFVLMLSHMWLLLLRCSTAVTASRTPAGSVYIPEELVHCCSTVIWWKWAFSCLKPKYDKMSEVYAYI